MCTQQPPSKTLVTVLTYALCVCFLSAAEAVEQESTAERFLDPALPHYEAKIQVAGSLRITGSETMVPLLTRLAAEFARQQPNAKVSAEGKGSAAAIPKFVSQPAKVRPVGVPPWHPKPIHQPLLIASSRELNSAEISEFLSNHGYRPTAIAIGMDAVAIYVNKANPLPGLTLEQADAIFSTNRKRGHAQDITTWSQLGLPEKWSTSPIHLYGRNMKSGTSGFFKEHVLNGGNFKPLFQQEPGTASVILAVSRDSLGLGFSGIALTGSAVRVLPLASGPELPFVTPSAKTVTDETYPLGRFLYLYVDVAPNTLLPAIMAEFLAFVTSWEGQDAAIKAGFFPVTNQQIERRIAAIEDQGH